MKFKNIFVITAIICSQFITEISAKTIEPASDIPVNDYIKIIDEFYKPVKINKQSFRLFDRISTDNLIPNENNTQDISKLIITLKDMRNFLSYSNNFSNRDLSFDELTYINCLNDKMQDTNIIIKVSYLKRGFEIYKRNNKGDILLLGKFNSN